MVKNVGLRIGSLFSGIGGLELGLERAGLGEVVWQCEIEEFPRRILAKHWPNARRFKDIRAMGVNEPIPSVEVICGGFPCQDLSVAGKGTGLSGARSGLFYELMRVVRLVGPRVVVLENVPALTARGLGEVLGELAEAGYDAEWACISAGALAAPHRRERLFAVAYANGLRELQPQGGQPVERRRAGHGSEPISVSNPVRQRPQEGVGVPERDAQARSGAPCRCSDDTASVSHPDGSVVHEQQGRRRWARGAEGTPDLGGDGLASAMAGVISSSSLIGEVVRTRATHGGQGGAFDAQPVLGGVADGVSSWMDRREWERGVARALPKSEMDRKTRRKRIKALGNAVVPQVAELVGRRIVDRLMSAHGSEDVVW